MKIRFIPIKHGDEIDFEPAPDFFDRAIRGSFALGVCAHACLAIGAGTKSLTALAGACFCTAGAAALAVVALLGGCLFHKR